MSLHATFGARFESVITTDPLTFKLTGSLASVDLSTSLVDAAAGTH